MRRTAAVDHDARMLVRARLPGQGSGSHNMLAGVVGALAGAAQDRVNIRVAASLDDGSEAVVGDTLRKDQRSVHTWEGGVGQSKRTMNACGCDADRMASTAIWTEPSVPFLKPIGSERPETSSRCNCDSVVRAPIAPQLTRSCKQRR